MTIPGVTSTGSKRPALLFGASNVDTPRQVVSAHGCTLQTDRGELLDFVMALGAVALGYGHPAVTAAVVDAATRGAVGSLPPAEEELLALELRSAIPRLESVRFLKSGAEAAAAAVRIARVHTGRDQVLGCGYHGWLDWCSSAAGVPAPTRALYDTLPFNDTEATRAQIVRAGDRLACVIVEPVVEGAPDPEWLAVLRTETERVGAVLIFDEIKTAFRVATGGAAERWHASPDLMVIGKAIANGYPLAAVGGRADIMRAATETWISSTLATEFVSLAASRAVIRAFDGGDVVAHLDAMGSRLLDGLRQAARSHDGITARGIPQMCHLHFDDDARSERFARACVVRGLLFKRTAYNFVSRAHGTGEIDRALAIVEEALTTC